MTFSGNPNVLDPAGAVDKSFVKSGFLVPTSNDINRIDALLQMGGTAFQSTEITTLARALVTFQGQTKPITLADLAAVIVSGPGAPFIRAPEAGMVGDSVTDDSFPLQTDMDLRSSQGGAVYFLRAAPGASFYFANSIRVPSNITLLMASPILLAKLATFTIPGSFTAANGLTGLRITAPAAAGSTTITVDTSPYGGGPVSTVLAPTDQIIIFGNRDGCGSANQAQELRVTAVNNALAQITVHTQLTATYPIVWPAGAFQTNYGTSDQTQIFKVEIARAAANLAAGENLVLIQTADSGLVRPGDMVLLKDDATVADISGVVGGNTAPCGEELAMIVPSVSGDPSLSVRLDRRASRSFLTSRNFRLTKLAPVTNVTVSGARFLSAASPDSAPARPIPWTEQRYTRGVVFDGCSVPNTDIFGKRGDAFRAYRMPGAALS